MPFSKRYLETGVANEADRKLIMDAISDEFVLDMYKPKPLHPLLRAWGQQEQGKEEDSAKEQVSQGVEGQVADV